MGVLMHRDQRMNGNLLARYSVAGYAAMVLLLAITSTTVLHSSLLSAMWDTMGKYSHEPPKRTYRTTEKLSFDVISIGCQKRSDLLQSQRQTFGSHPNVRTFYAMTEDVDTDVCQLDKGMLFNISDFCNSLNTSKYPMLAETAKAFFMKHQFISNRPDPAAWLCAQKRPVDSLKAVLHEYESEGVPLPHYLIIVDDDTYVNMDLVIPTLIRQFLHTEPHVIAGCRYRMTNLNIVSFPYGGMGTILTSRAVYNLLQPVDCRQQHDELTQAVCKRVSENNAGEQSSFQNGMSVMDLMYHYSHRFRYDQFAEWDDVGSVCLHSDIMMGYWINLYPLTLPANDSEYLEPSPTRRISRYNGAEYLVHGPETPALIRRERGCWAFGDRCRNDSHFCHYLESRQMYALHRSWNASLQL